MPHLEYAALSWMFCAAKHRKRLDNIQRLALRLVGAAPALHQEPECPLDTLEHRRDVGAIAVFHKAQVQKVSHLAGLHQPPRVTTKSTRTVLNKGDAVEVPQSNGCQHRHTFSGHVSMLWNLFTPVAPQVKEMNTRSVEVMAHKWKQTLPTLLTLLVI